MSQPPKEGPAIDPDNVPETFCNGRINISGASNYAVITFTASRPEVGQMIDHNRIDVRNVVRARIVLPMENLVALRDLLNQNLQEVPFGSSGKAN